MPCAPASDGTSRRCWANTGATARGRPWPSASRARGWWRRSLAWGSGEVSPLRRAVEEVLQLGGGRGEGRQVFRDQGATPPPALAARGQLVAIQPASYPERGPVFEGAGCEQRAHGAVPLQEPGYELHDPPRRARAGHGREPHLPVQTVVIRRDPARPARGVARLALEFVLRPARTLGLRVLRPLEHDLEPLAADAP